MKNSNQILNISYSKLFDLPLPWNSAEVFETACSLGFDAVKGDVTPSKDGRLIMCHDSYFYLDENGRVLEPGHKSPKKKMIKSMTAEECTSLEYASEDAHSHLGYYARVAELEDLIRICAEHGKIAYITVRDKQIELCIDEVLRLLKKYDMESRCIINSFSTEALWTMRKKAPDVRLSLVFGPNRILTKQHIDKAAALGNCAVCLFWWRPFLMDGAALAKSQKAMQYANEKGVELHFAHGSDPEVYRFGASCGFKAFQCNVSTAFR